MRHRALPGTRQGLALYIVRPWSRCMGCLRLPMEVSRLTIVVLRNPAGSEQSKGL